MDPAHTCNQDVLCFGRYLTGAGLRGINSDGNMLDNASFHLVLNFLFQVILRSRGRSPIQSRVGDASRNI